MRDAVGHAFSKTKRVRADKRNPEDFPSDSVILKRQANRESGAGAWRAVDFDRAVVIFDDFFGDEESQAHAACCLLGREIGIKNLAHLRRSNAGAGVFNAKIDIEIFLRASDLDRAFLLR